MTRQRLVALLTLVGLVPSLVGAQATRPDRLRRRDLARVEARRLLDSEEWRRPPRAGSVAVVMDSTLRGEERQIATGIAELLATDLARLHGIVTLERLRVEAIRHEARLMGLDASGDVLFGAERMIVVSVQQHAGSARFIAVIADRRYGGARRVERTGALTDPIGLERELAVALATALGLVPTEGERRSILDRPTSTMEAFTRWAAALDAIDAGDDAAGERFLRAALALDHFIDVGGTVSHGEIAARVASIIPLPSGSTGSAPTDEGLATEGNESEFGEAWFEGTGDRRLSVYELAVPLSASVSLGRGRLDLASIWASARYDTPANDVFHAWGFTDVHLRVSEPIGRSGATWSFGLVLPTRDAHGADDDIRRIPLPPDLLPTSAYRRRLAPTAALGLSQLVEMGAWTVGVAAGTEWVARYSNGTPSLHSLSVAPGLRLRLRADAGRTLGGGRVTLSSALTGSRPSRVDTVRVTGGERALARVGYDHALGSGLLSVGGWWLYGGAVRRDTKQTRASTDLGTAFVAWSAVAVGVEGRVGAEWRTWRTLGRDAADLLVPSFSVDVPLRAAWRATVGAEWVQGHFHEPGGLNDLPVGGWQLRLALRVDP